MWKQCCLLVLIQCVLLSAVAVDEEPPQNIAEDVQVEQLRDDTEDVQEEEYMSKMLSADTQENDDEKSEVAQDGYLTQSDDDNGELEELGEAETDEDSNDEAASQGCSRVYRCRNERRCSYRYCYNTRCAYRHCRRRWWRRRCSTHYRQCRRCTTRYRWVG